MTQDNALAGRLRAHRKQRPGAGVWLLATTLCMTSIATAAEKISPPAALPTEVSPQITAAIDRGLDYLKSKQGTDGSYSASEYDSDLYPTVMSAMVGLAFMANGSTSTRGPHAPQIRRITEYLLSNCVTREGVLTNPRAWEQRPMYGHAFAMTYLALVYGQESDLAQRERLESVLKAAIRLSVEVQSYEGGWGYEPDFREDEGTLTVTQTQALRTCRDAGLLVPKQTIDNAVRYIERSTNPDGSVRYRTTSRRSNWRPGVTSAAVVTLWQAGRYDDPLLKRISQFVETRVTPYWEARTETAWYREHHAEYVLYFLGQAKHILGGRSWQQFYRRASDSLVREQNSDGSWRGRDTRSYSEVYSTAMALLVLQLPFKRLPVYQR